MNLGIFVTHPVQYHVPLWRGLASDPELKVKVFYFSDQGVADQMDPGFGQVVRWDVPMLGGYEHAFLRKELISRVSRASVPSVSSFLSQHAFDAVMLHGYTHRFARQLIRNKKRFKYRVLLRGEFTDMEQLKWPLAKKWLKEVYLRIFYSNVDHFCPIGEAALQHLQRRGIEKQNITLTRYAADSKLIESQINVISRTVSRRQLGLSPDQVLFLFSGKLIPRKQPLMLAKIAETLAGNPRLALCYIGSGPQFDEIKELLASKLKNRLIMPGFVNQTDLGCYFSAADVFVLPSAYDTWGLVVNEAMQWGLPCIVSDRTGSHRDLIREGVTGFIHRWNDSASLRDLMCRFLDEPDLSKRLGYNAAQHIKAYRIEDTIESLRQAVKRTINGLQDTKNADA